MKTHTITVKIVPSETIPGALLLGFYFGNEFLTTKVASNSRHSELANIDKGLNELHGRLHVKGHIKFGDKLVAKIERRGESIDSDPVYVHPGGRRSKTID